jgi:hypothetical protein
VTWNPFISTAGLVLLIGLIATLSIRNVRKEYTPRGRAFFCLGLFGMGLMGCANYFATFPSSASRVTVVGRCESFQKIQEGRIAHYQFGVALNSVSHLMFKSEITPPAHTGYDPYIQDGELIAVTYLDEKPGDGYPRAIAIKILSGEYRGWHRSVDANWWGAWLIFPFGLAVTTFSVFHLAKNRRKSEQVEAEEKSDLIDLSL